MDFVVHNTEASRSSLPLPGRGLNRAGRPPLFAVIVHRKRGFLAPKKARARASRRATTRSAVARTVVVS